MLFQREEKEKKKKVEWGREEERGRGVCKKPALFLIYQENYLQISSSLLGEPESNPNPNPPFRVPLVLTLTLTLTSFFSFPFFCRYSVLSVDK